MSNLGTYRVGFGLALSRELVYRLNFIIGRIRELIIFTSLIFLFLSLPHGSGAYSQAELATYALVGALFSAPLFVYGMNTMSEEIVEGDFTNYILRPLNYFGYWTSQLLAKRLLLIFAGLCEVGLLLLAFRHFPFFIQTHGMNWLQVGILLIGSMIMIQMLDFLGGLLSFWTHRGDGPRWMITIFVQFLSGAYLPLDLLPNSVKRVLFVTPFPTLVYAPIKAYLGALTNTEFWQMLILQGIWIILLGLILYIVWKRGLKMYEAYGR